MMATATRNEIDRLHATFAGTEFTEYELAKIANVSISTLLKYNAVERVVTENYIPVTLEELVQRLNDCAGDDCYGADWEYTVINNQAFEVKRVVTFRVA